MSDRPAIPFHRHVGVWLALGTLAWFAHFAGWRQFGFLTDDQTFAAVGIDMTPAEAAGYVHWCAANFPEPQGRPLGFLLGVEIPFVSFQLAGPAGLWVAAWAILTVNAGLLYHLLARRGGPAVAAAAAVAFVLYPADTTRPYLCHADILQPSLTFTLVAAHMLLSSRQWATWLAYAVAALTLVTYETAVLPFLAVPLLTGCRGGSGVRQMARHVAAVLALVAAFGVVRHAGGDYRVADVAGNKVVVAIEAAAGFVLGPAAAVGSCGYRAWVGAAYAVGHPAYGVVVTAVAAACAFLLAGSRADGTDSRTIGGPAPPDRQAATKGDNSRVVAFGAVAFVAAYAFSFFHFPPVAMWGQTTSVHTAAALGGSTLLGGAAVELRRRYRPVVAAAVVASVAGLWLCAAASDQRAYGSLWAERQRFWPQVFSLCPDATDGTLIVVDGRLPQPPRQMPASTWADADVPKDCFVYPLPTAAPVVACYPKEHRAVRWPAVVTRDFDGRVVWADDQEPYLHRPGEPLPEGNTILLHLSADGRVTRTSGTIDVAGGPFQLRDAPPAGAATPFPARPFRAVLCGPESGQP